MVEVHFSTAESFYPRSPDLAHLSAPERVVRYFARIEPPDSSQVSTVVVDVRCNHARWIVECPWCGSAQVAGDADRRWFCIACKNVAVAGKWCRLQWPTPATRAAIEATLTERPEKANMNWAPGETVAALRAENARNRRVV